MDKLCSIGRRPYFAELDSIRFLAFLLIFIHHTNNISLPIVSDIQRIGWLGVDIFLCLSAFLLTRLLFSELQFSGKINLGKFYIRRILRIWPLYFGYLFFILVITIALGIMQNDHFRFLTLATFTDNVATAVYGYNRLLGTSHLWTISYEEQFYLILPFGVLLMTRLNSKWQLILLGSLISFGLLVRLFFMTGNVEYSQPAVWVLPVTHFESIVAGVLLALYYDKLPGNASLLALLAILSFALLLILPLADTNYVNVLISYLSAAVFSFSLVTLAVISDAKRLPWWLVRSTRYLGRISYGLYVFHLLCLTFVYHFSPFHNPVFDNLLALIMCILVAVISFEVFEKRFLELKRRYSVHLDTRL
jgi:peptidoglycan/LPS O-acetylase OafA/YrhL